METRSERQSRRRDRRHRIQVISVACAISVVLSLVAAACGRVAPRSDAAPRVSHAELARLRAVPVRAAQATFDAIPTTTTTTRPAVNPDTGPAPANSGIGRRIVYCNSCQTVWLIDPDEFVVAMYKVSGRRGTPSPGEYRVFRKLDMGQSKARPELRLPYFVSFTWGSTTDIGFHGIPLRPDGSEIQSEAQLGTPLSSGCIRESQLTARMLYDWTPIDTLVVVLA